jgi:hypothetical protein
MLFKNRKILISAAFVLLVVNIGFLCWYLFVGYQAYFHSDSATKVLIAREIVTTGDYFPNDWNYANKDLFVLFGHAFVIPLLTFLPAGYTAHAISGLVSAALILSGIWLLTSLALLSLARRLLIVASVAAGISGLMAENLFGQASYGTVLYIACYAVFFAWRFITAHQGRQWLWGLALLMVMVLAFWSNPQRGLVAYGIPLLAAALTFQVRCRNASWWLMGIIGAGIAMGTLLHLQTLAGVNNVLGAGNAHWLTYDLMLRNVALALQGYFAIFGGLPTAGTPVVSAIGLYEAVRLITTLLLLVLMPLAIFRALRYNNGLAFLSVFALIAFLEAFFFQVTTTIPDMNLPVESARYLVPALVLMMIIVLLQPLNLKVPNLFSISVAFISVILVTSAYPAYIASDAESDSNWNRDRQSKGEYPALSTFLAEQHLQYGYSTYWNSGVISVLSNENVLVRQIVIAGGSVKPMRHLSSNRWFRPSAWQGETFLLLSAQEAALIDWEHLASYGVKLSRELAFGDYKIYVFAENIAKHLPGWDTRYEEPATFMANKSSLTQTGRFVENMGEQGGALIAEKGQSGVLHFGPFVEVEPGRYDVSFDVLAKYHSAGAVRLDVVAAPDQKLLGEKLLLSSEHPHSITFTLDKPSTLEFRVFALGNEQVIFKSATIKRIPNSENN